MSKSYPPKNPIKTKMQVKIYENLTEGTEALELKTSIMMSKVKSLHEKVASSQKDYLYCLS